ncbi:hypothetical protein GCM10007898_00660 [Dyella flagellata]|uniref:DUF4160 domain-containing protein n=1 Tax=Dyella flagellata TaxID=1867833 RepID=A0ABQ5X4E8_9GAMM|nr:hypothetical protein GCM10007898_00660 [Dyella flagellata]
MKVCKHDGLVLAVLTRDEHCPPHVHVGPAEWSARFKFSFWHNSVCLWDVVPVRSKPSVKVLEGLRQALMKPAHLRKAREAWWSAIQTMCLEDLQWDVHLQEVVSSKARRAGAVNIQSASFDAVRYHAILRLKGQAESLEIGL